ncbi:FERM, RhoGEF and pleckstrin domain-containing protein 1-like [Pitangus sulphuratus]|nr:FERM, RhoGEF and pleckstrin domain-containing protein 1-like [Pitangus sulphuratus]
MQDENEFTKTDKWTVAVDFIRNPAGVSKRWYKKRVSLNMGETEQRPTAGSRLGAQENAGISTLEHGQKPPMTPPGKLVSIKIQMLDDTQETFDIPLQKR